MGNKIFFKGTANGPVQEDMVDAKDSVKFYCNEKFWIIFDSSAASSIVSKPTIGWFAPAVAGNSLEFLSEEIKSDEWVVKIKFQGIPSDGLKYTVRLDASGLELDPRVVPPRVV